MSDWELLADDDGAHGVSVKAWGGEIVLFRRTTDQKWQAVWTSDDGVKTITAFVHRFDRLGVDDAAAGSEALNACASHDAIRAIGQAMAHTIPDYWEPVADQTPPTAWVGPDPL